jgi:hypothetical protein
MFQLTRYISNTFSIFFPRQMLIRRKANQFEDLLSNGYSPPQIIPVPDDMDPGVPRLLFTSKHGFSQIVVSQISVSLNVPAYSPDWQTDVPRIKAYLMDRIPVLYSLLAEVEGKPYYSGLDITVQLATEAEQGDVALRMAERMFRQAVDQGIYDFAAKVSSVVADQFFSNVTWQNYRKWPITESSSIMGGLPVRFPRSLVVERGVEIQCDFNDRYAFNEREAYHTSLDIAEDLINRGFDAIADAVTMVGG